ncbi:MAG TPA: hypothetical protein VGJ15_06145, partial [Pirellulales bacterium]
RKLDSYCNYVASDVFQGEYPKVDKSKIAISVVSVVPTSTSMRKIRSVITPGDSRYEIIVLFADEKKKAPSITPQPTKKRPWWQFWG